MKYMGSKNRLSKEIAPIIQSYIDEMSNCKGYLEPFVGGANMIDKIRCENRYGSDIHKQLIALLKQAQTDTSVFPLHISEDEYNKVKINQDAYDDWYVGLVGFCATFGGKYFNGYARSFKEDKVTPRDMSNETIRNIIKQAPDLKGIHFSNCSFLDINDNIKNFVIYCDPPYRGTSKYKTDDFPYEDFYKWCKQMSRNNVVLISEYNMPENDFECIWSKETKVLLDSKKEVNNKNNNRIEKLFICKGGEKE